MFTFFRAIVISLGILTLLSGGVRAGARCTSYSNYAQGSNPSEGGYEIAWSGYDADGDYNVIWEHPVTHNWILMYFLNKTDQVCTAQVGTESRTRILGLDI